MPIQELGELFLKMDAISEAGQSAGQPDELGTRIAKRVLEVDAVAVILPRAFSKSRLETLRILAQDAASRSQALVLAFKLDRPPAEILESVEELRASLTQLRLMSSRARIEQGTLLSLLLIEKLTGALSADLSAWQSSM